MFARAIICAIVTVAVGYILINAFNTEPFEGMAIGFIVGLGAVAFTAIRWPPKGGNGE